MGKGIVKLGEGNWAVKDGNLLAAKETNGRFKNAEFTVTRGTRATYVGRDGLIKESNLQDTNLVPSVATIGNVLGGSITQISSNSYSSTSDGTTGSSIFPKFNFNTTSGKTYKLVITPTGTITGTVNFDFYDGSSYLFQNYDFTTTKEIYFTDNGAVFGGFDGTQTYSIDSFTISIQEVKINTPRIDFTDNTDGHLLLEPQSTNLITYSEDFSDSSWINTYTITPNSIISPDGTLNAYKITLGTGNGNLRTLNSVSSNTDYVFSFYAKRGTASEMKYRVFDFTNPYADIIPKTSYYTQTNTDSWVRIEVPFTTGASTTSIGCYIDSDSQGDGDFYAWGAQLEELPYASSYIPTNGSTVTRDAETCTGAGETADFNSEEGVLYVEISGLETTSSGSNYITITDGTYNNRASILFSNGATNQIRFFLRVGGALQVDKNQSVTNVKSFNKVAFKYKANDFAVWINGVEVSTDTSGSVWTSGTINELTFSEIGTATGAFRGKVKAIKVYKEALSDTDLQNLTS